jgi:hypothetical protein
VSKENNKNNWLKVIGLIGAVVLILFGNVENLVRTVKLASKKEK